MEMISTTNQNNEVRQNAAENGTKIFVNLPVSDLKKTMNFFSNLGFTFNPMFTNENATCMVIGEDIYVMLLVEKFFKDFIPDKEICDTKKSVEAIVALSANTRKEVDELIRKAIAAGGSEYIQALDYGWMYGRAFQDINGHIWEIIHMDMNSIPEEMKKTG